MRLRDTTTGWGLVTRLLHWGMALLILGLLGLGFYMVKFEQDLVNRYLETQWHKSFGFTVFTLALLRILWRWLAPARPGLPPGWQSKAATLSHLLLYALMLALPLSGWLMASSAPMNDPDAIPFQVLNRVFDLFTLPDPFPKGDAALENRLKAVHETLAFALLALLALHSAAALKHHFTDRNRVLMRMISGR